MLNMMPAVPSEFRATFRQQSRQFKIQQNTSLSLTAVNENTVSFFLVGVGGGM